MVTVTHGLYEAYEAAFIIIKFLFKLAALIEQCIIHLMALRHDAFTVSNQEGTHIIDINFSVLGGGRARAVLLGRFS